MSDAQLNEKQKTLAYCKSEEEFASDELRVICAGYFSPSLLPVHVCGTIYTTVTSRVTPVTENAFVWLKISAPSDLFYHHHHHLYSS